MAQNRFSVSAPNILESLMTGVQGYEGAQKRVREADMRAGRQAAADALRTGGDTRNVLAQLIGVGDVDSAKTISDMERARTNDAWTKTYQGGMLDIARQNALTQRMSAVRGDVPEKVRVLQASGIDPSSPEGRQALFKLDEKLGAADKKAIFEAEDENTNLKSTVEALQRAKELNPKVFSGVTAGARGFIGANVPGGGMLVDREGALATQEWEKLMQPEALQAMAKTLKGATTDFELRTFIKQLADPTTDPNIRASIIDRMAKMAERQAQVNQTRMDQLRGGNYYKQGGGQSQQQALPQVGETRDGYRFKGGDPASPSSWVKLK